MSILLFVLLQQTASILSAAKIELLYVGIVVLGAEVLFNRVFAHRFESLRRNAKAMAILAWGAIVAVMFVWLKAGAFIPDPELRTFQVLRETPAFVDYCLSIVFNFFLAVGFYEVIVKTVKRWLEGPQQQTYQNIDPAGPQPGPTTDNQPPTPL